jgi:4-hydroxy-tetrahydrodipicolinate reductase
MRFAAPVETEFAPWERPLAAKSCLFTALAQQIQSKGFAAGRLPASYLQRHLCIHARRRPLPQQPLSHVYGHAQQCANHSDLLAGYNSSMSQVDPVRIAVYGASGRMGASLLQAALSFAGVRVQSALVRANSACIDQIVPGHSGAGQDDLTYQSALDPDLPVDVLIDFSAGEAFDNALAIAVEHRIAFISGTTGLQPAQQLDLHNAALRIPVLWSANFSLGVALLKRLSTEAASALGPEFEVEIIEAHHARKEDAPSGTALALGKAIAEARGQDIDQVARRTRDGLVGARDPSEIGFSTIRGGDIVGEHTVMFIATGERIELTHRAGTRDLFARGALRAAQWIKGRRPGLYSVEDVISGIA